MINVIFPDGSSATYSEGATFLDILKGLGDKATGAVAVRVDGETRDLSAVPVMPDGSHAPLRVEPVPIDSREGIEICRHSASHVMAEAVKSLYGGVKLAIGPATEDGFYYDFDAERPFTPADLEAIEARMREIIKADRPFVRETLARGEALALFESMGERYKAEIIGSIEAEDVTVYRHGGFVDLCRGPHLPSTGWIKAFKLVGAAGAYWRGSEKNRMLQRIYGTAFADKAALKAYFERLEEARKRDHRKLGKDLDLFSTSDDVGAGLVLWHPDGAVVRRVIEDFWKDEHARNGYSIIYTPHIAAVDLWKTSGHWDFYRENMYSPMEVEGADYIVKPMNCPFHIQVYKTRLRSYRDLPVRYAELGTVYRYERSGVLHGLLRVRGFTQDDAHIFVAPDDLEAEIKGVLDFTVKVLRSFGFGDYDIYVSTRPEKYVGTIENWDRAEAALKGALDSLGLKYAIDEGEGVFYGPKIDIKIKDVLNRAWQCSTIQVDFNLPERFDVAYRDSSGKDARPIMIHRALMGSLERFFGCLVEHYAGAFPAWLAPVQAAVMTVTQRNDAYADGVVKCLRAVGLRAEADLRNEKLGLKIREAGLRKIPYLLVVGDSEEREGLVAPRKRGGNTCPAMTVEDFVKIIGVELHSRGTVEAGTVADADHYLERNPESDIEAKRSLQLLRLVGGGQNPSKGGELL
jgi:threonyl-tRNA synthetase